MGTRVLRLIALGAYSESIEKDCDEVEFTIASTRQIIVDMAKVTKIGRRWAESLNNQLDDIMVGNRRLGRTGYKILGCWEEQREELASLNTETSQRSERRYRHPTRAVKTSSIWIRSL